MVYLTCHEYGLVVPGPEPANDLEDPHHDHGAPGGPHLGPVPSDKLEEHPR